MWCRRYNGERPHSALGNIAPETLCPSGHSRGSMTHETNITTGTKNGAGPLGHKAPFDILITSHGHGRLFLNRACVLFGVCV